ncbi:MAG: helix-turn-helix transcriptional regulator [Bdellovibrionaceae bacterium]|nr:helix-turn-helix transcriptional regulator [Pseudobdellovibrionaceae bacterium]
MNSNILGSYLKRKRVEMGMAQADVASKLGYTTPQYISNFERGVCQPSLKIAGKLAGLYKLDMKEFFDVIMEQQKSDISEILFKQKRTRRKA